ncbi:CHASE domain-containing protein [Roseibium aggregatum]|uniref:histidine kinase n=1 Tax=Roseibium aggregatum TaxID=187304 RepID=A0A926S8Z1_9HYPH|nr:CHASE domain-containing protein [Roseibium aggregatum]MBD1549562.1 histidine kinase [Roseibium aggregatum]
MIHYLPPAVFIVVSLIGAGMTAVVYNAEEAADRIRFENLADDAVDRVVGRIREHITLLISTHSFFSAQAGRVERPAFERYVAGLDLEGEFEGIRGIGYARLLETGDEAEAAGDLQRNYGLAREVWPETSQDLRTPIVLLEPSDERNRVALGYDMFSEDRRRNAMRAAMESGKPTASAPVELVQEITSVKQAGFLVYIPFKQFPSSRRVDGFVYAPFRAGDLHRAALDRVPRLPVTIETTDTTEGTTGRATGGTPNGSGDLLFRSAGYGEDTAYEGLAAERVVDMAGRQWTFKVHATPAFRTTTHHIYAMVVGAVSLLLAIALAMSSRFQLKAVAAADELRRVSEKTVQEKDLMLQEMKHRIKNSIARVLAIARQTAANSDTIDEFSDSFTARLNAMANAQDMLTRSHWQRADLRELLNTELEQVFGNSTGEDKITGPKVLLDERTTQALGLTFHELATNALKYGGISTNNGDLHVNWAITGSGKSKRLQLDWIETSAGTIGEPEGTGFGSRLIDANIRGELGGTIDRSFHPDGMTVRMNIPL